MPTKFEQHQADWSSLAHEAARKDLYPKIFSCDPTHLTFENTIMGSGKEQDIFMDGNLAIDRIVGVKCSLHSAIRYTIQERYRRKKYQNYRDITITEFNHQTNMPSELYKISSLLFVYAYWDELSGFGESIALHTLLLLEAIRTNKIAYTTKMNNKRQSFICIKIDDLLKNKELVFHHSFNF